MAGDLALDAELERRARRGRRDAKDLLARYIAVQQHLEDSYYSWVQAECPYFTDHGHEHIRSVAEAAGRLLRHPRDGFKHLSCVDVFLVLSGVIWHDIGMVWGRSGHAAKVVEVTEKVKELAFPDPTIHRLVDEIARAHSGAGGLKAARPEEVWSSRQGSQIVHPRALAAVVRFADEVSENRTRISPALMGEVPVDRRIYWEYANAVSGSVPEPARERVIVSIEIQADVAIKRFPCDDTVATERLDDEGMISLIEYILCRLEKMNNERAYCGEYFGGYTRIREIEMRLIVCRGAERVEACDLTVMLGDSGLGTDEHRAIPVFSPFFEQHPDWRPERLKEVLGL